MIDLLMFWFIPILLAVVSICFAVEGVRDPTERDLSYIFSVLFLVAAFVIGSMLKHL